MASTAPRTSEDDCTSGIRCREKAFVAPGRRKHIRSAKVSRKCCKRYISFSNRRLLGPVAVVLLGDSATLLASIGYGIVKILLTNGTAVVILTRGAVLYFASPV